MIDPLFIRYLMGRCSRLNCSQDPGLFLILLFINKKSFPQLPHIPSLPYHRLPVQRHVPAHEY